MLQLEYRRRYYKQKQSQLTLVGTVGVSLITVIPTVIVPVTRPVLWDAAAAVAFKLDAGARMAASGFIAVIATVVVCHTRVRGGLKRSFFQKKKKRLFRRGDGSLRLPLSQRQLMLMQRPLAQVNWVSGKQVGYAEKGSNGEVKPRPTHQGRALRRCG